MTTALLDFSKPHVLRAEAESDAAIAEIERLLNDDVAPGGEGYESLEFLSVLVEHYEDREFPMGPVTPQQAVTFMLEQKGVEPLGTNRAPVRVASSRAPCSWP